ncbi:MAG: hypothetical protein WC119_02315 [Synergistaceae bacterium]
MNSQILDGKWTDQLKKSPETGMGYQMVNIVMEDGSQIKSTVLNCEHIMVENDFQLGKIKSLDVIPGWGDPTNNGEGTIVN